MQFFLVGLHLETVHVFVEGRESFPRVLSVRRNSPSSSFCFDTIGFGSGQRDPGLREGSVDDIQGRGEGRDHRARGVDLVLSLHREPSGLFGGGAFGLELLAQRLGLCGLGAYPFPGGLQLDPRLHLGGPGRLEFPEQPVAGGDVEHRARVGGVGVAFRPRGVERGFGLFDRSRQFAQRRGEALAFGLRGFECDARPAEGFTALGEPRFERLEVGDCSRCVDLREVERFALLGERESLPLDRCGDFGEPSLSGVAFGGEFDRRTSTARSAAQNVLREHVAFTRDHRQPAESWRPPATSDALPPDRRPRRPMTAAREPRRAR